MKHQIGFNYYDDEYNQDDQDDVEAAYDEANKFAAQEHLRLSDIELRQHISVYAANTANDDMKLNRYYSYKGRVESEEVFQDRIKQLYKSFK